MMDSPCIVWFRSDLRVDDHPALMAAVETGRPIIALYIYDQTSTRDFGAASQWWLHHSLLALRADLERCGLSLLIMRGDPELHLPSIVQKTGAKYVAWNRRYDGHGVKVDSRLKAVLSKADVEAVSFKGNVLSEPWEYKTGGGSYYKVFTPYWKSCLRNFLGSQPPLPPLNAPHEATNYIDDGALAADCVGIDSLNLLPTNPDWAAEFSQRFTPGRQGALEKLERFIQISVEDYAQQRDRADIYGTSRLSPHLAFGEISPRQIWEAVISSGKDASVFLSEIGWREFSYVLLFHNPNLAHENFKSYFDGFKWDENADFLEAWQQGRTGYPYVDAGMRELWATGWQHNRVRMVTASFLIKHLLQDWRLGEAWFWDTLVDADPAANAASWQWVAGSGADASPYFRIFNPFSQGQKFDPEGDYVRRWVPELAKLPKKYIHTPWDAPAHILAQAGVRLGQTYPRPIVEHKMARDRALAAYKASRVSESPAI